MNRKEITMPVHPLIFFQDSANALTVIRKTGNKRKCLKTCVNIS